MKFPVIKHEDLIRQFENAPPKSVEQMNEEVRQMEIERIKFSKNKQIK
jgi:hypothetical protein